MPSTEVGDYTPERRASRRARKAGMRQSGISEDPPSNCIVDPYAPAMQGWDLLLVVGLAYTSIVTPFDAAFLDLEVGNTVFFLNLLVDVIFIIDIFITFSLPFADPVSGLWVRQRSKIAHRYVRSWFILDVISVFPFDWILLSIKGDAIDSQALRSLRLLKLLKIARIVRGNRIYKRWRDRLGFNLTWLAMWFYISFTLLMAHWVACILGVMPYIEGSTAENLTPEEIAAGVQPFNWQTEYFETNLGLSLDELSVWSIYLASMYWSIMTITTIGFGDVAPKTDFERVFMCVLMFFGASLQAFLIGTICGLVAELSESSTIFRATINSLNEFMTAYDFDDELRVRLRMYFAYAHSVKDSKRYAHLLESMSPALQSEVSLITNSVWVKQVPFIEMADSSEAQAVVLQLSKRLAVEIYAPFEIVCRYGERVDKLYIVSKGLVVLHVNSDPTEDIDDQIEVGNFNVRLSVSEGIREELSRGQCFGHELIYAGVRSLYNCTTLQFCELHVLTKVALDEVLEAFPLTRANIEEYTNNIKSQYPQEAFTTSTAGSSSVRTSK